MDVRLSAGTQTLVLLDGGGDRHPQGRPSNPNRASVAPQSATALY